MFLLMNVHRTVVLIIKGIIGVLARPCCEVDISRQASASPNSFCFTPIFYLTDFVYAVHLHSANKLFKTRQFQLKSLQGALISKCSADAIFLGVKSVHPKRRYRCRRFAESRFVLRHSIWFQSNGGPHLAL